MSLLPNWFAKKTPETTLPPESAGARQQPGSTGRRQQRMERRELLYAVIREAMVHAGVLTASYTFKVLSLEPQGGRYIIMVDLARDLALESPRQTEVEKQIVLHAKAQHNIQVSAIYWRVNDRLKGMAPKAVAPVKTVPRFEPIGADEVAALRHALAVGMAATQASGFEDTEVIAAKDPYPVLSRTQYGDLN
ncbi:MAG: hypothetical protein HY068_10875 [Burkholderiales bacterium]|nr:hypothetical protein [Burkholderiales bacterium]